MSHDQKVMMLLRQWRSTLWMPIKEMVLLPKFDKSRPDFQAGNFANFEQLKVDSLSAEFG